VYTGHCYRTKKGSVEGDIFSGKLGKILWQLKKMKKDNNRKKSLLESDIEEAIRLIKNKKIVLPCPHCKEKRPVTRIFLREDPEKGSSINYKNTLQYSCEREECLKKASDEVFGGTSYFLDDSLLLKGPIFVAIWLLVRGFTGRKTQGAIVSFLNE
jgi:hypothetical protein